MLAKGHVELTKKAALLDLENPTDALQKMAVGEAWFQAKQKELKFPQYYYARAYAWFSAAESELSGDEKNLVQGRLRYIRSKNLPDDILERASLDYDGQFGQ